MQTQRSWVQIPHGAEQNGGGEGGNYGDGIGVGVVDAVGEGVGHRIFGAWKVTSYDVTFFQDFFKKNIEVLQFFFKIFLST